MKTKIAATILVLFSGSASAEGRYQGVEINQGSTPAVWVVDTETGEVKLCSINTETAKVICFSQ